MHPIPSALFCSWAGFMAGVAVTILLRPPPVWERPRVHVKMNDVRKDGVVVPFCRKDAA